MDFVRVDVARELYEDRQQALVRYQHKIENRRSRQALREQQLIVTAVEKKAREKEKVEWLQKYNRNLKNQSGSRYDILTLQYSNASEQSHCEDSIRFRAEQRVKNLIKNGGTRANYDIISGVPKL